MDKNGQEHGREQKYFYVIQKKIETHNDTLRVKDLERNSRGNHEGIFGKIAK